MSRPGAKAELFLLLLKLYSGGGCFGNVLGGGGGEFPPHNFPSVFNVASLV